MYERDFFYVVLVEEGIYRIDKIVPLCLLGMGTIKNPSSFDY